MPYDFIAIDFETANQQYDSACSIGIAAVSDLKIVDTYYSLIQPIGDFLESNTAVHGITRDDVKDAPLFFEIWPDISHFFGKYAVLAHNALFDMSVLKQSRPWMYDEPEFKYIDTISLCKGVVPGKKDLGHCAECLNIPLNQHHNALDDAIACAEIAIECIRLSGAKNLGALCFALPNVKIHSFSSLNPQKSANFHEPKPKKPTYIRPADIKQTVDCVDPTGCLYGKSIVFTGELTIGRAEAMQIAVNAGAIVRSSVSKKTNFLVVGVQDKQLVGEDGLSSKEEKAYELNSAGTAHIEIIDEQTFLDFANREVLT